MNRDFHNRGRAGERFDFSFFHTPEWADQGSLDEYHQIVDAADQSLSEANALPQVDALTKRERQTAITKAKSDKNKAEAAAKKKGLPKPKAGLQPRVSAIYRPAKAKAGANPGGAQ